MFLQSELKIMFNVQVCNSGKLDLQLVIHCKKLTETLNNMLI